MRTLFFVAAALLAPAAASAADLSGAWKFEASTSQGTQVMTCNLTQSGTKISGHCISPKGRPADPSGSLDGTAVDFGYDVGNGALHLDYKGDVQADGSIKGRVTFAQPGMAPSGSIPFTGTRQ